MLKRISMNKGISINFESLFYRMNALVYKLDVFKYVYKLPIEYHIIYLPILALFNPLIIRLHKFALTIQSSNCT